MEKVIKTTDKTDKKIVDKVKMAAAILVGALAINVATSQNANAQISPDIKKDTTRQNQQLRAKAEINEEEEMDFGDDLSFDYTSEESKKLDNTISEIKTNLIAKQKEEKKIDKETAEVNAEIEKLKGKKRK